ncbi:MAG: hypothetical protein R3Y33_04960 [Clostridia bacterium]
MVRIKFKRDMRILVAVISLLTHNDDVVYEDYVYEISKNPLPSKVKLADLKHNSDLSRLDIVTDKDKIRSEKYKKSILFLEKSIKHIGE